MAEFAVPIWRNEVLEAESTEAKRVSAILNERRLGEPAS